MRSRLRFGFSSPTSSRPRRGHRGRSDVCGRRPSMTADADSPSSGGQSSPGSSVEGNEMLAVFRRVVPKWDPAAHKGQMGRVAVVGGSEDYAGAPFFAAMGAMRAGADLATVFCERGAAAAVKAYSPDVVVVPDAGGLSKCADPLRSAHALVVGPGLGRRDEAARVVEKVVEYAGESGTPVVLDADALWFLARDEGLREKVKRAGEMAFVYVTPNGMEMRRLREAMGCETDAEVVEWFDGRVVVVRKGMEDVVAAGEMEAVVTLTGAKKRVGGQGDILAGMTGLFAFWAKQFCDKVEEAKTEKAKEKGTEVDRAEESGKEEQEKEGIDEEEAPPSVLTCKVAAATAACMVTRRAAEMGFDQKGRSLVTSDILGEIGAAFEEVEYGTM